MAARILDGKSLATQVRAAVKRDVEALAQRGIRPGLAVVLAGDNPASRVYVRNKVRACEETGVRSELYELPATISEEALIDRVLTLNDDPDVHGILVQLPLPKQIDAHKVLETVTPAKDVDGFHESNLGALVAGNPRMVPCTPAGVMRLLAHADIAMAGAHAVVVGRSNIVGKPLALLLLQKDATVTICHSKSRDLEKIAASADILVAAVGKAKLGPRRVGQPRACGIDVGGNRLTHGALAGDAHFGAPSEVAGWVTPVPGGVGPITLAHLLDNVIRPASPRKSSPS